VTTNRRRDWRRAGWRAESRTRWLLGFAALPFDDATRQLRRRGQASDDRTAWEAHWSARGTGPGSRVASVGLENDALPSWTEITNAHFGLTRLLNAIREEQPAELEAGGWRADLVMIRGRLVGFPDMSGLPFEEAFGVQAYHALSGLAAERRWLRFCARPQCRRPFVADHGSKRYDEERCSAAARAARYRRVRPDRYDPEARHAAYERAVRKRLRNPRLKIARRPRRAGASVPR
jgi:hypothetical protein